MVVRNEWAPLQLFNPLDGVTIAEPPDIGRGNWAGAANIWFDETGDFWLVYRLRKPPPASWLSAPNCQKHQRGEFHNCLGDDERAVGNGKHGALRFGQA